MIEIVSGAVLELQWGNLTIFYVQLWLFQEREKLREEKRKYVEYLKQWSKPREDMECDDLKVWLNLEQLKLVL